MDVARRYDYNLPWIGVVVGTLFYAGLSAWTAHWAAGFDGAAFVTLLVPSAIFGWFALVVMTRRFVAPRVIELTDDAIHFPHGFPWTRIARIRYAEIIRISEALDVVELRLGTADGAYDIQANHFCGFESYVAAREFICRQASIEIPSLDEQEKTGRKPWDRYPEPILQWREPEDLALYRTRLVVARGQPRRLGRALWVFARWFGGFTVPWLLLRLFGVPAESAVCYLSAVTVSSLLLTFVHWGYATYPGRTTKIAFRDRGITQDISDFQTWDFGYRACRGWTVVERLFEGRLLRILLIQLRWGVVDFALPDTDTRDRVTQLLRDKQIPQTPALRPPWE